MEYRKRICVVAAYLPGDHNEDYIKYAEVAANKLGYETVTYTMPHTNRLITKGEEKIYDLIDYDSYSGVIFIERSFFAIKSLSYELADRISAQCKKPVVVIDSSLQFGHCVRFNGVDGFEQVTDHMIDAHGCRRLYCLGGSPEIMNTRIDGFCRSLEKHGLDCPPSCILYGVFWSECAEKLAEDIAVGNVEKPRFRQPAHECARFTHRVRGGVLRVLLLGLQRRGDLRQLSEALPEKPVRCALYATLA